jgi:hypothetical protein
MVNDLRVGERLARPEPAPHPAVTSGNALPRFTGGQVVAGSNPVSPTGISAAQRLFWLIGPQASTIAQRCHTLAALVKRFAGVPTHPRPWS